MRRTLGLIALLLIAPTSAVLLDRSSAESVFPRRFAEVEPGRLYRGGQPTADQVAALHDRLGVRAIVSLTTQASKPGSVGADDAANRLRMPVTRIAMPGDGRAEFEALDAAADVIQAAEGPVFFHCSAGKMRSNAVTAAWRMKHGGWPLDKALAELRDRHDLDESNDKDKALAEHLRAYRRWLDERQRSVTRK